jgi:hypothetical protein
MTYARYALFLIGCIGTRAAAAWLAYSFPQWLPYMGIVAALIAAGFFTIYLLDLRKTGAEVFGERIWWNHLRPVHGAIYAGFAVLAFKGSRNAWILLAADVLLGLAVFINHRILRGN